MRTRGDGFEGFFDDPELVSEVTAADIPASWRVQVADPYRENADAVRALVAGMPGIEGVVTSCDAVDLLWAPFDGGAADSGP